MSRQPEGPPPPFLEGASRLIELVRVARDSRSRVQDHVAGEEPLEIRLGGSPLVVIMRTPGADRELVAGFLLAERIVRRAADVKLIRHCTVAEADEAENTVNVWLEGDAAGRAAVAIAERRAVASTSSCGVCGRRSIDDLLKGLVPLDAVWTMPPPLIVRMPERLRSAQSAFAETGGVHAAGLFDRDGALVRSAEDIGRHNAVDKVVGSELLEGRFPLSDCALMVSGRTSFEIVQKAAVAGIPLVAAVSAPSSLAIQLASDSGMTLIGFVRGDGFNVYTHPHRVRA